jgi:hypothetical protein
LARELEWTAVDGRRSTSAVVQVSPLSDAVVERLAEGVVVDVGPGPVGSDVR